MADGTGDGAGTADDSGTFTNTDAGTPVGPATSASGPAADDSSDAGATDPSGAPADGLGGSCTTLNGNPGSSPANDPNCAAQITSFTVCSDTDSTASQSVQVGTDGTVTFAWSVAGDYSGGIVITGTNAPDTGGAASGTATMQPSADGDFTYELQVTDGAGLNAYASVLVSTHDPDDPAGPHATVSTALTSDLSDAFFTKTIALGNLLGCLATDLLNCWMSESTLKSSASSGVAYGINQITAANLPTCGFSGGVQAYLALTAEDQVQYAQAFYLKIAMPTGGVTQLTDRVQIYIANGCPAAIGKLQSSTDPNAVICGAKGPYAGAYPNNLDAFDNYATGKTRKGYTTRQDMIARLDWVKTDTKTAARWAEVVQRVQAAGGY
jgi:hypothetical protein